MAKSRSTPRSRAQFGAGVLRAVVPLSVCALLTVPAPAAPPSSSGPSSSGPVSIGPGCSWLNTTELARLTRLELANQSAIPEGLEVGYSCTGNEVSIRMASPAIALERRVANACCDQAEPERALALLAIGLYAAAESMLRGARPSGAAAPLAPASSPTSANSTPSSSSPGSPSPSAVPALPPGTHIMPVIPATPVPVAPSPATPSSQPPPQIWPSPSFAPARQWPPAPRAGAPIARVPDAVAPPAQRVPTVHEAGVGARARFYNLADAVSLFGVAVDYRHWLWPTIHFGGFADASFGSANRQGGAVDARVFQLGVAAGWRILETGPLSLTSELRGGGSLISLSGRPNDARFRADDVVGLSGHLSLSLVPMLQSGRIRLGLPFEAGVLFRAPRGLVAQQEQVRLDGFWLGLGVAVSVGWGEQPAPVGPRVANDRKVTP